MRFSPALLLAASIAAPALVKSADLAIVRLEARTYPEALCNDGSSAAYYLQASTTNSPLWIVHQQGKCRLMHDAASLTF